MTRQRGKRGKHKRGTTANEKETATKTEMHGDEIEVETHG